MQVLYVHIKEQLLRRCVERSPVTLYIVRLISVIIPNQINPLQIRGKTGPVRVLRGARKLWNQLRYTPLRPPPQSCPGQVCYRNYIDVAGTDALEQPDFLGETDMNFL